MARIGAPHVLLGTLLLSASDAGSHITGQAIFVGGGVTAWVGASPYPEGLHGLHGQLLPHGSGDRIVPAA